MCSWWDKQGISMFCTALSVLGNEKNAHLSSIYLQNVYLDKYTVIASICWVNKSLIWYLIANSNISHKIFIEH